MFEKIWLEKGQSYLLSAEVRTKVFVEEQGYPIDAEFDSYDDICPHFVICDGNKPVATGRIFMIENSTAKLGRIAVLKEYRGLHLGEQIMNELIQRALEMGAEHMYISAQSYAVPFYEKFGFKPQGEEYLDIHIPHYDMFADV